MMLILSLIGVYYILEKKFYSALLIYIPCILLLIHKLYASWKLEKQIEQRRRNEDDDDDTVLSIDDEERGGIENTENDNDNENEDDKDSNKVVIQALIYNSEN